MPGQTILSYLQADFTAKFILPSDCFSEHFSYPACPSTDTTPQLTNAGLACPSIPRTGCSVKQTERSPQLQGLNTLETNDSDINF